MIWGYHYFGKHPSVHIFSKRINLQFSKPTGLMTFRLSWSPKNWGTLNDPQPETSPMQLSNVIPKQRVVVPCRINLLPNCLQQKRANQCLIPSGRKRIATMTYVETKQRINESPWRKHVFYSQSDRMKTLVESRFLDLQSLCTLKRPLCTAWSGNVALKIGQRRRRLGFSVLWKKIHPKNGPMKRFVSVFNHFRSPRVLASNIPIVFEKLWVCLCSGQIY